jgi:hypothetical protein
VVVDFATGLPSPLDWFGRSFLVTSLLPATVPVTTAMFLLRCDAWSGHPDWRRGWDTLTGASLASGALIIAVALAIGLVMHPLTSSLARIFEGRFGTGPVSSRLAELGIAHHRWRMRREAHKQAFPWRLIAYPSSDGDVKATAMGNVQTRHEVEGGVTYGLIPRNVAIHLRFVAPERDVALLDDVRLRLDSTLRLTSLCLLTCAVCICSLWRAGLWMLLALFPYAVAAALYRGAIVLAKEYGAVLSALVDLNRHELYRRVGRRPAPDSEAERAWNQDLKIAFQTDQPMKARRDVVLLYDDDFVRNPAGSGQE